MDDILKRRPQVRQRFLEQVRRDVDLPSTMTLPADPQQAWALGVRLGRTSGYGDGLVDGTELGLDVVLEAMDAMMKFPVFAFGGHSGDVC